MPLAPVERGIVLWCDGRRPGGAKDPAHPSSCPKRRRKRSDTSDLLFRQEERRHRYFRRPVETGRTKASMVPVSCRDRKNEGIDSSVVLSRQDVAMGGTVRISSPHWKNDVLGTSPPPSAENEAMTRSLRVQPSVALAPAGSHAPIPVSPGPDRGSFGPDAPLLKVGSP